jgi:cholesterol transport system auxiliary component
MYLLTLTGCALPGPANMPVVYDFGPGALQIPHSTRIANLPPLEFSTPQTSTALNSTAVLYRLAYADAQQLKPYAMARWSMPPAQLIGQRLRSQLGLRRAVVLPGDITPPPRPRNTNATPSPAPAPASEPLLNLHLELDEFSQLFVAPDKSSGMLRLRATVTQRSTTGDVLLGQRSFIVQHASSTADANGGVRALTAATDQAILEIDAWLGQLAPAGKTQ